jgi:hypothetical protein
VLTACRASAQPPSSFLGAYSVPIQRQFEMFIRGSRLRWRCRCAARRMVDGKFTLLRSA